MTRPDWLALVLLIIMSVASGFVDLRIRQYPLRPYAEFIPRVVDGTADAPERYRVLVPFTIQGIASLTGAPISTVWHVTRLAAFLAAYLIFYAYLRLWFSPTHSLLGTGLVAATLPLTFTNSWAHPDHIPELALFTAGCAAVALGRLPLVAVILALAALNRETAVFLIPLYLLTGKDLRSRIPGTALLALEYTAIYAGLRFWRGFAHYDYMQLARNLQYFKLLPAAYDPYYRSYAYFGLLLFGGFLLVALNQPGRPLFMTRALWIVPMFGGVAFVLSSIIETRIFTPVYPLVVPSLIFGYRAADRTTTASISSDDHD